MGKIHPHKFRRAMATRTVDKRMSIEQEQMSGCFILENKDSRIYIEEVSYFITS